MSLSVISLTRRWVIENNNPMALLSQSLNESLCDLVNKEVSDREQQPHGFTVTKS